MLRVLIKGVVWNDVKFFQLAAQGPPTSSTSPSASPDALSPPASPACGPADAKHRRAQLLFSECFSFVQRLTLETQRETFNSLVVGGLVGSAELEAHRRTFVPPNKCGTMDFQLSTLPLHSTVVPLPSACFPRSHCFQGAWPKMTKIAKFQKAAPMSTVRRGLKAEEEEALPRDEVGEGEKAKALR
ncbi:hypothetical protein QTO34_017010 [Cnephaeus nilssonii]|uniref:Phosphofurin acidic cluster sorting protein 1/2 C-terminal domain-containing protein n=1 Tax=Cnephaeus nilssonii TaxID=3371016 RepID=A0AA40HAG3_CNENI|nr:hypothetical protein QTO34_017010 [Eptesicus nilssonii]